MYDPLVMVSILLVIQVLIAGLLIRWAWRSFFSKRRD